MIELDSNFNSKSEWGRNSKPGLTLERSLKQTKESNYVEFKEKEQLDLDMKAVMKNWIRKFKDKNGTYQTKRDDKLSLILKKIEQNEKSKCQASGLEFNKLNKVNKIRLDATIKRTEKGSL